MKRHFGIGIFVMFFLGGCSSVDVTTDYDRETDFAKYRTFGWMKDGQKSNETPSILNSQLARDRVMKAIEIELASKGISRSETSPDIFVKFYSGVKENIEVEHFGYRYGRWHSWWGNENFADRYKEGAFVVDLIDAKTKDLVWRGIAEDQLRDEESPERIVNSSMRELFKEYPPPQSDNRR